MALRPELNLMARQADLTTVFPLFQQARDASQRNQLFPIQQAMLERQDLQQQTEFDQERRQALISSVVQGSAQVKPLIDAGNIKGTMDFLTTRREQLINSNLPTETTDAAIALLQDDPQAFKDQVDANVQFGIQSGILGGGISAGQGEFESLIAGFSPEEQGQARRVRAGLIPRAVGSAAITTAQQGLTEDVAESEAIIRERETRAQENAKGATGQIKEFFTQLGNIESNIVNYNEAIKLIDEGAATGVIASRFPSIRAASQKLDNVKNRLGLDVVGNTTFGALSESELNFAIDTALPTNLEGQELKQWLIDKRNAQQKLADYIGSAIEFLNIPGNTLADLQLASPRQQARTTAVVTEQPQFREGQTATGPNGEKIVFRSGQWVKQ